LDLVILEVQLRSQQTGDMADAETVIKAGVQSAWVDQVGHRKLANPAKPLEDGRISQPEFLFSQPDEVVDRIANAGSLAHLLRPPASRPRASRNAVLHRG